MHQLTDHLPLPPSSPKTPDLHTWSSKLSRTVSFTPRLKPIRGRNSKVSPTAKVKLKLTHNHSRLHRRGKWSNKLRSTNETWWRKPRLHLRGPIQGLPASWIRKVRIRQRCDVRRHFQGWQEARRGNVQRKQRWSSISSQVRRWQEDWVVANISWDCSQKDVLRLFSSNSHI